MVTNMTWSPELLRIEIVSFSDFLYKLRLQRWLGIYFAFSHIEEQSANVSHLFDNDILWAFESFRNTDMFNETFFFPGQQIREPDQQTFKSMGLIIQSIEIIFGDQRS